MLCLRFFIIQAVSNFHRKAVTFSVFKLSGSAILYWNFTIASDVKKIGKIGTIYIYTNVFY